MKFYNKLLVGAALLSFMSCTKDFEEMNVNPNQPAVATSAQLLANAQYNFATNIGDAWNNARMGMYYAQYWSSTYYTDESRYLIREGTNQTMWNTFYADVLKELSEAQKVEEEAKVLGFENRIAIAEIFKAMTYHYLSDIYGGPIPYAEALDANNAVPKYNTGPEVYAGLLATLEEQIAVLKDPKNMENPSFAAGDVVYKGNTAKWIKFANSLRLRIALRMIDVNQEAAVAAIRKSLDPANGGIIESNADNAMFKWLSGAPNNNPLNEAYKTRIDFSVAKPFVDYLKKYDDPRLKVYANPLSTDANAYVGETYGLETGSDNNSNGSTKKVSLPSNYVIGAEAPTVFLDYAEVEFMLAEIAARGLNVGLAGTAAEHYAKGIKASFDFAGLSNEQYVAYLAKVPYVATDLETAKDLIGSQKWIAMYGQGIQGWLERLRLDFEDPYTGAAIFALPADGSLDPNVTTVPFRMSYPVTEASLNAENYNAAVQALGGANSKGAKAWWDVF
ncbi:SusD/RagB family nutrient-binding outer membrane lipoprotein [Pontibacter ruber]|uniref:SusD/RagB family nutrient-binding outer membrane lipoprotein n=1 Tax=Pontibacter ruber TaxID=1343895 RepID=A0ABW5D2M3_9BACT|nr:SusD/RagB family nutrient-binding outer membrane lipoprotein [Pontibacter ruber]